MTLVAGPVPARTAVSVSRPAPEAQWRSPERDLWVGTDDAGAYLGMVERDGASYRATDGAGREIGAFWSLGDAEAALADAASSSRLDPSEFQRTRLAMIVAGLAGASALAMVALGVTLPF